MLTFNIEPRNNRYAIVAYDVNGVSRILCSYAEERDTELTLAFLQRWAREGAHVGAPKLEPVAVRDANPKMRKRK